MKKKPSVDSREDFISTHSPHTHILLYSHSTQPKNVADIHKVKGHLSVSF